MRWFSKSKSESDLWSRKTKLEATGHSCQVRNRNAKHAGNNNIKHQNNSLLYTQYLSASRHIYAINSLKQETPLKIQYKYIHSIRIYYFSSAYPQLSVNWLIESEYWEYKDAILHIMTDSKLKASLLSLSKLCKWPSFMTKSTTAGKLCIEEKKQIERVGLVKKWKRRPLLGDFSPSNVSA